MWFSELVILQFLEKKYFLRKHLKKDFWSISCYKVIRCENGEFFVFEICENCSGKVTLKTSTKLQFSIGSCDSMILNMKRAINQPHLLSPYLAICADGLNLSRVHLTKQNQEKGGDHL